MKKQNTVLVLVTLAAIAVVLVGSAFDSSPQAKGYEYATITQSGYSWLSVSAPSANFTEEKLNLPKPEMASLNTRPMYGKVSEFEKNGWELVQVSHLTVQGSFAYIHIAEMRRPIP